ncbi:MAG: hypothetical protein ABEH91_04340 [Halopenitus sp.]
MGVSAPPVAIGPEMTAALLATADAIALVWFSVKIVAGFREYRQVTNECKEEDEGSKGSTADTEAVDAGQSE